MKQLLVLFTTLYHFVSFSQDPTYITVRSNDTNPDVYSDSYGENVPYNGFFWSWWQWSGTAENPTRSFVARPEMYFAAEYDLSKEITAHYYNLGLDFGTNEFMIGAGVKLPNHAPNDESQSSFFSSRIYRKFMFNGLVKYSSGLYNAELANFQIGAEHNFAFKKLPLNSESTELEQRQSQISPFLALYQPIFAKLTLGAKFSRLVDLTSERLHYSALALQCSYDF